MINWIDCSLCAHKDICKYKEQHMSAVTLMVEHESFYDKDIAECKYYKEEKNMDDWKQYPSGELEEGEVSRSAQLISDTWSEMKDAIDSWIATLPQYEQMSRLQCRLHLTGRESDMIKMYRLMQPDSQMIVFSMVRKFYDMDYPNADGTEL